MAGAVDPAVSGKFLKNFWQVSVFQLFNSASAFAVNILIAHAIGVKAFGNFFFFVSTSIVAAILFDFGLTRTLIRYSAFHQARGESAVKLRYYSAVLRLKTILGFAVLVPAIVASHWLAGDLHVYLSLGLLTGWLISYCQFLSAVAQTEDNYLAYNLVLSFNSVRLLGAIALLLLGATHAWSLYALFMLSPLLLAFWPALRLGRDLWQAKAVPEAHFYRTLIGFGKWMMVLAGIEAIYQRLDVVLVRSLIGAEAAGLYSGALAFFGIVYLLPAYIAALIYPKLVEAVGLGDEKAFAGHYRLSTNLVAVLGIPLALGLWSIGPEVVRLVLGPDYQASLPLFKYLAGYSLLWACQINSGAVFFAKDQPGWVAGIMALVLLLTAALIGIFIPWFGMQGAGMAVAMAMAASLLLYWSLIKIRFNLLPEWRRLGVYLLAGSIMAVAVHSLPTGGWGMLAGKIAAGGLLYAGLLLAAQRLLPGGALPPEMAIR